MEMQERRTKAIDLILKTSTLKDGFCGIKQKVPIQWQVKVDKNLYYLTAYYMIAKNGKLLHRFQIHDILANSVKCCKLEDIQFFGEH